MRGIRHRRYCHLHFALPCQTLSRARRPGGSGPPPLRSNTFPWGYPDLEGTGLCKVVAANKLIAFVIKACRLAAKK
eukprot:4537463-Pyramimonas_sp.AAC.1